MNLTKLFETQRILDARIEKEHPKVEGEDRLAKKILALQVEIGECANEWRGFKFWSNDQKPRSEVKHYARGSGKSIPHYVVSNPLLEEYVDCLHFILSIGLNLDLKIKAMEELIIFDSRPSRDTVFVFSKLFHSISSMNYTEEIEGHYYNGFQWFVELGHKLGFTWEQIEKAYCDKNEINHTRQDTGY